MESISSLIRDAGTGDPLARSMEAVLESGLVVFTRDSHGRFVQLSPVLNERLGMGDARGAREPGDTRTYDVSGRALSGNEYPGTITRSSGTAQHEVLLQLECGDDSMWMQMSTMPLERTPDGWSVLTVGADVTALVEARDAASRAASVRGALLEVGAVLADGRVTRTELVELLRKPMAELVADGNVLLTWQDGDEFEMTPVHRGFGTGLAARRGRLSQLQRDRWQAGGAHVNQDVQLTDIYGASVVAELELPFRSVVIAPSSLADGSALGALVMNHPEPDAFEMWQIESLELAGRLLARTLHGTSGWAERRSA
ncbi:MAG: hypothetical protein HOH95_10130 [Dehalococcoidia bacterium]|nr:hypothetical protein [Dehalococcoidia bacterium]